MAKNLKPFEQLPFAEVPETPIIPHDYFTTESRTVKVPSKHFGNVEVNVRIAGSGPALLLVHGFMTTNYSWRYVMKPLSQHFTVYAPDLIGAGKSSKPDVSYGPQELAASIGEIMNALGITGCAAIGNSLGGYLCMQLAMQDKSAFSKLVNLHSPGLSTPRMQVLRYALNLVPIAEFAIQTLVNQNPERWVHTNVHYYDESLKSREEHREYAAPLRTKEGFHAFYRMLKDTLNAAEMTKFEAALKNLRGNFPIPLLLLYARRDPMVPAEMGERFRKLLPGAKFQWLERGSHFAHVDAPDVFLENALPFLLKD